MNACPARRTSRCCGLGGNLASLVLTLALALLTSTAAGAAGSSSTASSSSGSGSPFPAKVEDFADCTLSSPGWGQEQNQKLSAAFNEERWTEDVRRKEVGKEPVKNESGVQEIVADVIERLSCKGSKSHAQIDKINLSKFYFSVLFFDESSQPPALARVVVHSYDGSWKLVDPPGTDKPEVYGSRIGDFELYDLRLLPEGFLVASQYQVGTSSNPLITQIPGVIGQLAGGVKPSGIVPVPAAPSSPGNAAVAGGAAQMLAPNAFKLLLVEPKIEAPALPPTECEKMVSDMPSCELAEAVGQQQRFLIRRVSVPLAFQPNLLRQPSVIPQVSITDQLVFSSQLESYVLASLRHRAMDADGQLALRKLPPKVVSLEERLFKAYYGCRVHISTDLAATAAGAPRYLVARVLNPAGGPPLPDLCVGFDLKTLDGAEVASRKVRLPKPLLAGTPQTVCWAAPVAASGNYLGTAEVFDEQRSKREPKVEVEDAVAAAVFAIPAPNVQLSGALTPSAPAPNWGDPFSLAFAVRSDQDLQGITVTIFDSATGKRLDDPRKVTRKLPKDMDASGSFVFSTAKIGLGTRFAVLEAALTATQSVPVASAGFRVVGGMPGTQVGASSVAPGPACLVVDDSSLGDDKRSQEAAVAYGDLAAAYSWLLAQATPPPAAAPAPTTYTMGKLTRYAFSLGVAGMFQPNFHRPPSELTTPLSWVAVDIHPLRYDETRFSPDFRERLRAFLGIAITPNIGVVGGWGIGLFRGLTAEGGFALLLTTVEKPHSAATYRGPLGAWFVGLGYSLQ
jgi:hypothetical protein